MSVCLEKEPLKGNRLFLGSVYEPMCLQEISEVFKIYSIYTIQDHRSQYSLSPSDLDSGFE